MPVVTTLHTVLREPNPDQRLAMEQISEGWLVLYHGVRHTPSGCLYRLGLALFELENPEKCLLRGDSWIFGPEADYERHGDALNIYYGAADCSIALARSSVRALLTWLDDNGCCSERRRARPMTPLARMFKFVFGCRHRHLSRVFTIKNRTYKVCFDCGEEFDLPDSHTRERSRVGSRARKLA